MTIYARCAMVDGSNNQDDFPPITTTGPGDGTTQAASRQREPIPEFEGYQILEELPRGGQAIVYKALHKATKTKVALKVLAPGLLISARARHQFEREIDLISGLEHPYIVHIRDSGIAEGQYYFAMEYVRGQPLDEYVISQGLSLRLTMELFLKVCEAVSHAHQRGVIHRDLKPSNILVGVRGDPHVLDFGLAKGAGHAAEGVSMMSITGEIKGTLSYMSPEQAAGQSHLVGTSSDVYTLGVVFYRTLARQFPYDVSGTTIQTLHNIQAVDPIRPRHVLGRFDADVETILLKALAKNPSDRYHSAAELGDDIRRWLQCLPINARQSTFYTLRKLACRHWVHTAIFVSLIAILVGYGSTYYYLYNQLRAKDSLLAVKDSELNLALQSNAQVQDQLVFGVILDLWHEGQYGRVRSDGRRFLDAEGAGWHAVEFLLDSRPLSQKSSEFQEQWGASEPFFTTFVIAEHELHDGNPRAALSSFRTSLGLAEDRWGGILRYRARSRIIKLLGTEEPGS